MLLHFLLIVPFLCHATTLTLLRDAKGMPENSEPKSDRSIKDINKGYLNEFDAWGVMDYHYYNEQKCEVS
jgi:hypothetical protein